MKNILLLLSLFCSLQSIAQTTTFSKNFRFDFPAATFTSVINTDSNYIITGIIADTVYPYLVGALFTKFDLEGNPLLVKTHHASDETLEPWFPSLNQLPDNSFILTGYSYSPYQKGLAIKYDFNGDIIWLQQYNHSSGLHEHQHLTDICPLPNGSFLACSHEQTLPSQDIVVRYLDSLGQTIWTKKYSNGLLRVSSKIIQINPNEWIISGIE